MATSFLQVSDRALEYGTRNQIVFLARLAVRNMTTKSTVQVCLFSSLLSSYVVQYGVHKYLYL